MVEAMDKFIASSFKVLRAVLSVVLLGMVAILMAHIFCRYILNSSLTWSEELLKILLVWFGMLSVSLLAIRREHMPKRVAAVLSKVTQIITVLVCLVVIYVGANYVMEAGYRPTPALGLPYGYAYAAIPISFLFVTVYEIRNLIVDLTGKGNHAAIEKPEEDLTGGGEFHLDMKE